jgi:MFS family permease
MAEMTFKERLRGVSLIFACGTALFSDGYANGVIGSVNTLLTRIYGAEKLAAHNHGRVLTSLGYAGTVIGMLLFGYLSDKIGRKFGMMTATGIVAVFSLLSAASSGANHSVTGLLSMLSAMRFLLGIGIGAEYPCGSVSASEQSEGPLINKRSQHRWVALATNTMIDFGFVIASFVPLVLFWIFGNDHLHAVWRLSLGLGVVPAVAVFIWRLNMEEPLRYKKDSMKYTKIPYILVLKRYGGRLAAISAVWFLYDLIVYPFGLYSSIIFDKCVLPDYALTRHLRLNLFLSITGNNDSLGVIFGWNVVSNLFYMPGTIIGAYAVDYLGAKNTLIIGLVLQAIIGFIMSALYTHLANHIAVFAVVYGIFLSFGEFGPGICTIILAGKSSPTAVRGQFFGTAAAVGKVGAFVGTWIFPPIIDAFGGSSTVRGNTGPFWIGSGCALLSAFITFFFITPLTMDGMEKEDREFREYLEAHGYDTTAMGLPGNSSESQSVEEASPQEKSSMEKA